MFLIGFLGGCVTPPNATRPLPPSATLALLTPAPGEDEKVRDLSAQLMSLSPSVDPTEANRVAVCAYRSARELTAAYAVVGPALFQNFLINIGVKKRGLCYQWALDLIARLNALPVQSMELRWGVAHPNSIREHNCVVITANGQPFSDGIVLDCWRNAGRLYVGKVSTDRYPWHEEDHWDWRAHLAEPPTSR